MVIDARNLGLRPALLPRIVDQEGQEVYVGQVVTRTNAVEQGVAGYAKDVNAASNNFRVTDNPAVIKALSAAGTARTDIVIGQADAQSLPPPALFTGGFSAVLQGHHRLLRIEGAAFNFMRMQRSRYEIFDQSWYLSFQALPWCLSGCGATRHVPRYYDANNPLKRIAVLPMKNDTNDVDGPNVVRKRMIEALENRSYMVKDVKETDQLLRDQMGINLGGQFDTDHGAEARRSAWRRGCAVRYLNGLRRVEYRRARRHARCAPSSGWSTRRTGAAAWERGLGVRTETRMARQNGKYCVCSCPRCRRPRQGSAVGDYREQFLGRTKRRPGLCRRARCKAPDQGHRYPPGIRDQRDGAQAASIRFPGDPARELLLRPYRSPPEVHCSRNSTPSLLRSDTSTTEPGILQRY